ncbi:MAG: hypothetical protein ACREO5_11940 [Candidatus Binatia bacterium]
MDEKTFRNPAEGLQKLGESYDYWTGKITDLAFQTSLALIAANWAVISNAKIPWWGDRCLIGSILFSTLCLIVSVAGAWRMANLHSDRFAEAIANKASWKKQWEASENPDSKWPYTSEIERFGSSTTRFKVGILILALIFFGLGSLA